MSIYSTMLKITDFNPRTHMECDSTPYEALLDKASQAQKCEPIYRVQYFE